MKTLLLSAAAILATLNIHAQGTFTGSVNFSTSGVTDPTKQVWINDTGVLGQGSRPTGNAYNVALYWAPAGTTDERAFVRIGPAGGFSTFQPGTFNLGGRTITYPASVAPVNGAVLAFQVRAWDVRGGNDYDVVVAIGFLGYRTGKGPIFEMKTKDDSNALEPRPNIWETRAGVPNPNYYGFALVIHPENIPEPSVLSLALLAAGAFLIPRRRK